MKLKTSLLSLVVAASLPIGAAAAVPKDYTVSPGDGATVEQITTITISCAEYEELASYPTPNITANGTPLSVTAKTSGTYNNVLTYTLDTPITEAGSYLIDIPAGAFWYEYAWQEYDNDPMSWTVNVTGGGQGGGDEPGPGDKYDNPAYMGISPEQGTVTSLKTLTLSINDNNIAELDTWADGVITLTDTKSGAEVCTAEVEDNYDNTFTITLSKEVTEPSSYTLVIPGDIFYYVDLGSYDDVYYPATKWLFIIDGGDIPGPGPDPDPDPDPENPQPFDNPATIIADPAQGEVSELKSVKLTFTDQDAVDTSIWVTVELLDYKTGETVTEAYAVPSDADNAVIYEFDNEVTEPGIYVLNVPEGAITDYYGYEDMPATKWLYILTGGETPGPGPDPDPTDPKPFDNPATFHMTPAQGTVKSLRQFTIAANVSMLDWTDESLINLVDYKTGEKICGTTVEESPEEYNELVITLEKVVDQAGVYVLDIPAGALVDYLGNEDLPASKWLYIIEGEEPGPDDPFVPYENDGVTISPEQGKYTALNTFTLTFRIQLPDINYTKQISLIDNATGSTVATGKATTGAVINQLIIDLDKTVDAPGTYTLLCPEGTFYNAGSWDEEDLPEFKFLYIVSEDGQTIDPGHDIVFANPESGSTIGALNSIILTYPDFNAVYKHSEDGIVVLDSEYNVVAQGSTAQGYQDMAANEMKITFTPEVTVPGEYKVVIPARAFVLGDMRDAVFSAPLELAYTIKASGIGTIEADGSDAEFYNLQGIRITNPEPGNVYIMVRDGKSTKVLVK